MCGCAGILPALCGKGQQLQSDCHEPGVRDLGAAPDGGDHPQEADATAATGGPPWRQYERWVEREREREETI